MGAGLAVGLVASSGIGIIYMLLFATAWKGWMVVGAGSVFGRRHMALRA
jgi:hypothetical protein